MRVIQMAVVLGFFCSGGIASAQGTEIVIPNVAAFVLGAAGSFWSTEVRLINPTGTPRTFSTVDWIGTPRWTALTVTVPPGETRTLGGWTLYTGVNVVPGVFAYPTGATEYGAAVARYDPGLVVLSRTLTMTAPLDFPAVPTTSCAENQGGYVYFDAVFPFGKCNAGMGPSLLVDRGFFDAGTPVQLFMLNAHRQLYRTNLVIINPDPRAGDATVAVTDENGTSATMTISVAAHAYVQVNDLFGVPTFRNFEEQSDLRPAMRATVVCSTRCYPIAYVIANHNNTVSISEPH